MIAGENTGRDSERSGFQTAAGTGRGNTAARSAMLEQSEPFTYARTAEALRGWGSSGAVEAWIELPELATTGYFVSAPTLLRTWWRP